MSSFHSPKVFVFREEKVDNVGPIDSNPFKKLLMDWAG